MLNIDAQIQKAFDTGKKIAQDKPDFIKVILKKILIGDKEFFHSEMKKVYNGEEIKYNMQFYCSNKEMFVKFLGVSLMDINRAYRFSIHHADFQGIHYEIEKMFFKKWLEKTQNIYRGDTNWVESACKKLTT